MEGESFVDDKAAKATRVAHDQEQAAQNGWKQEDSERIRRMKMK